MPTMPLTHGCESVGDNWRPKNSFSNVSTFSRTLTEYTVPGTDTVSVTELAAQSHQFQ